MTLFSSYLFLKLCSCVIRVLVFLLNLFIDILLFLLVCNQTQPLRSLYRALREEGCLGLIFES